MIIRHRLHRGFNWDDDAVVTTEEVSGGTLIQTYYPHATFDANWWNTFMPVICIGLGIFCIFDIASIILCIAAVIATWGGLIPACILLLGYYGYASIMDCCGFLCCTRISLNACKVTYSFIPHP